MSQRKAFTIIELLVVISIIALLISILLPSLAGARNRARYTKWKGYSHGLRIDPNLILYYNFEEQDGSETKSHTAITGGTNEHLYVNNRAAGDPLFASKFDWEPEDYRGWFGHNVLAKSPEWTFTETRWKGKGGALFSSSNAQAHIFAPEFEGLESPRNDGILREFTVIWWSRFFQTTNWNQQLGIDSNGDGTIPWGNWLFHSTSTQAIYAGTGTCCSNGRFEPADTCCANGVTPIDKWNLLAYARRDDADPNNTNGEATFYTNGGTLAGGKQTLRTTQLDPASAFGGFGIGNTNTNSKDGIIDEVAVFKKEMEPDQIKAMYQVGKARRRE